MLKYGYLLIALFLMLSYVQSPAQEVITVRPQMIDSLLVNPGVGFNTSST